MESHGLCNDLRNPPKREETSSDLCVICTKLASLALNEGAMPVGSTENLLVLVRKRGMKQESPEVMKESSGKGCLDPGALQPAICCNPRRE